MEPIQVLLCCGAGLSSGFLAQGARKVAKKKGLNVKNRSQERNRGGLVSAEDQRPAAGPAL